MKVTNLINNIEQRDIVLPEFQREYVWSREQAKQLIISLVKEYPVGSLLFWQTDNPPDLKNLSDIPEKLGTIDIILDGQQRLTTLYMLIKGEIPPFYTKRDIKKDPRDLYFNLETGAFQYYQSSKMKDNPLWWRVTDCFSERIKIFEIAKEQAVDEGDIARLAERYNDNLNRLQDVLKMNLPVLNVPSTANIDDAIDIFDRVNSKGTKLTDAELALTHVVGKWPQARRAMKAKLAELNKRHFYLDLTFTTRALTGVVTQRALFPTIHDRPKDELKRGWQRLEKILDYLVTVLPQRAFIDSTKDLNTNNVLIPLIVYLSLNDGKFPSETALKHAFHWLYAAHTWSRYTAQTDQRLEHDISVIVRDPSPWSELRDQIIDQRGRIEVKASDLEGRGVRHPLYRMTTILAKAHGAIDWFNGAPLSATHGAAYKIHRHHIFPKSLLYDNGYDPDNHLHRKIANEIANRAFLTADSNINLSNTPPEEYLPEVEERYPGALASQFIPMDPELWKLERYPDFLQARRALVAAKINEFMDTLITEPEIHHKREVADLIGLGESATLEFKSTLRWDVIRNQVNKDLQYSALKTIAAFLNSNGGTLIIGVEDDGTPYGLKQDLKTLSDKSLDAFEQTLMNLIHSRIGPEYAQFIKTRFEEVKGDEVCVVDVDKAPEPAFMSRSRGKEFYVRLGNTTRSLDAEETHRFIQMNWE